MPAVLMRLCDEDRESFGGPEWVRFDEADLDDLSFTQLHEIEADLNTSIEFILRVDKVAKMQRWTVVRVWLARRLAGIETPPFAEFDIKPRRVTVQEDLGAEAVDGDVEGDDVDPPSSWRSSADEES